MRKLFLGILFSLSAALWAQDDVLRSVNLFLGTADDYGQLAPGATVPFGQVQVCPDSKPRQHAGYDFEVPVISGISLNRLSGVGGSGCGGNVSLMPDGSGRDIRILKTTEEATPGYYGAMLDNGVRIALTATDRMAVERFVFPRGIEPVLVLNPKSSFEKVHQASFSVVDARTGTGMVESSNTCGRGRYHLYYKLFADRPFESATLDDGRVCLSFGKAGESDFPVEVRIVVSTGLEAPLAKVRAESVWQTPFRQLRDEAARQWAEVLNRVEVKGGGYNERTLFYTSLYRVFHSPFQVTGEGFSTYLGTDGKEHNATDGCYYSSWSLWDTYRTKFPMILLLQPERSRDIMNSLAQLYLTGKKDWSTDFECVPTVRTEHAIATLLDALRKGIVGPNMLRPAYPGMVAEAQRLSLKSPDQVLEAASDFWALGQLAGELGQKADAQKWQARGEALFDSIWPKAFMNIDDSYTKMRGNGLYQGTRWQYRWGAPMFLDRMIRLCGRQTLQNQLSRFFREQLYNQGNEPDIHVPFLFGRLGQPLLTGPVVQELMLDSITHRYGGNDAYPTPFQGWAFRNATRGYAPEMDEDDGTMSAWYCFAALGLYPTIVGEPVYDLFSPLFDEAVLKMDESGRVKTVIRTQGRRSVRQPLRRVTWNGQALPTFQISHARLAKGGQLVFWY